MLTEMNRVNVMRAKPRNKKINGRRRERGVVLIAILMFVAMILPITLLILDTVRIESLLPVNEAYTRTAGDEADKGFYDALAAIVGDQDSFLVDPSRDPLDGDYLINTDPDSLSGRHEYDYLAEMWARHPDNDTVFIVERSLENWNGSDPDEHSVPARWQLMNVPFGMDDFGEFYADDPNPRILLPFEYVGENSLSAEERRAPAYYIDPSEDSMLNVQHDGASPSYFASQDLATFWQLPPSDPQYYENIGNGDTIVQFIPRPASYFRNTHGNPVVGINGVGLPAQESDATFAFLQGTNEVDRLVYDCLYDYDEGTNQYPEYIPLQQAVTDSMWANEYFGSTNAGGVTAAFVTSNLEYKPSPGTMTPYQLGAQEEDAVPGWHMAIVSDEAGRFPVNNLLNIIFSSHNLEYIEGDGDPDRPIVRRDQYDTNLDLIDDDNHPNNSGWLMARDILTSLLMSDLEMARLADTWDNVVFEVYQDKAVDLIRQMLVRRNQLDLNSDFNRDGLYDVDDDSNGEIFQFPEILGNNDSPTINNVTGIDPLDGSGRIGDGQDLWDGTWRVFENPKDMLSDFAGDIGLDRLTQAEFELLNQRVTVYTMDTEHTADPDHPNVRSPLVIGYDVRHNINRMWPDDDPNTQLIDESALWDYFRPILGTARMQSIINWREGLVDLNGDGDLDDEYVEQPVSSERFVLDTGASPPTMYEELDDWPVSTLTYRERNHPNYQDPSLAQQIIDPDYLNIKSLGDMITIPMSSSEGLIAYSEAQNVSDTPALVIVDEAGVLRYDNGGERSIYPDFSNAGADIAYDDSDDTSSEIFRNQLDFTNEISINNGRYHVSWGPGDALMAYYNGDGDDIYTFDTVNDVEEQVLNSANMAPIIEDSSTDTAQFWSDHPDNLVGDAIFEMGSPDINPDSSYAEIAFSQVADNVNSDVFLDFDPSSGNGSAYNIATVDYENYTVDTLTDNEIGTFDYAPDFSQNGEQIIFTRTDYNNFINMILNIFGGGPVPVTTLMMMNRDGSALNPVLMEYDIGFNMDGVDNLVELDFSDWPDSLTLEIHQPMFPNFSPDGRNIVFMDIPVTARVDLVTGTSSLTDAGTPDVRSMAVGTEGMFYQSWRDTRAVVADVNDFEIFPDWGLGNIRLSYQQNYQSGSISGIPVSLIQASTTDGPYGDPFTDDERDMIAQDIQEASLALRWSSAGDDQNWRYKDLPAVPEHVVNVLEAMADVVCFRDPYVGYDAGYNPGPPTVPPQPVLAPPIQAYPGLVNINTATRPVLRSLFLLMFQGPNQLDPDDDGDDSGPQPRWNDGSRSYYINLMDLPEGDVANQERFMAMMIADRYAHQVCEYRRWIYNNQGNLGVTDETVPSNLPLYENEYSALDDPPIAHYGNYRANPFYPLTDTDPNDAYTQVPELTSSAPAPPFRTIVDLFKVMLYDDQAFSDEWTYEGIDASGGPDPDWLPESMDEDGPVGSNLNALDVYGPIYNAEDERTCSHPDTGLNGLDGGIMSGFEVDVWNDATMGGYNNFNEHQQFRLFSADDFRRIAPFITVRTYNYRIESRGVIRIASGLQRTDITRDKIWYITTNVEANYGSRLNVNGNQVFNQMDSLDSSFLAQNRGTDGYYVLYFEETPQSGLSLVRGSFLPE